MRFDEKEIGIAVLIRHSSHGLGSDTYDQIAPPLIEKQRGQNQDRHEARKGLVRSSARNLTAGRVL
jgi:hypothetical protein